MDQPFGAMPSPFELANKNKSTTVTMSLRIKQTTKDFFEQQAKIIADSEASEGDKEKSSKTSASSLMNNLLDSYAESYTQQAAEAPITTVLKPYLENMAKKILKMDDESLIFRAFRDGHEAIQTIWSSQGYNNITKMLNDFTALVEEYKDYSPYNGPLYPIVQSKTRDMEIGAVENDKKSYFLEDGDDEYYRYIVNVPAKKWPTVIAVVDAYVRKMQELTHENDEIFSFSAEKFKELVGLVDSTDDKEELIKKLVKFFVNYAEQIYEQIALFGTLQAEI